VGRDSSGRGGDRHPDSSLGSDRSWSQRWSARGSGCARRPDRPRPSRPRSPSVGAGAAYQSGRSVRDRGRGPALRSPLPRSLRSSARPSSPASRRSSVPPPSQRRPASYRPVSARPPSPARSAPGRWSGTRSSGSRSSCPRRLAASPVRGAPRRADRRTRSRSRSTHARASSAAAERSRGGGCEGVSVDPPRPSVVPAAGRSGASSLHGTSPSVPQHYPPRRLACPSTPDCAPPRTVRTSPRELEAGSRRRADTLYKPWPSST
jgi:hypothetical protein